MTIKSVNGPYGGLYYSCPRKESGGQPLVYDHLDRLERGVSSISTGTFTVVAPAAAEYRQRRGRGGSGSRDERLRSRRALQITWVATSSTGIASQTF